jgi:hypothetical protein
MSDLPRIRLTDGGEFRVFQIRYTPNPSESYEHSLGGAPRWQWTLWRSLPNSLQTRVPMPRAGIESDSSDHPALSIWWAYIDPKTGKREIGPTSSVTIILDNGGQLTTSDWPNPTGEGYRQILIVDPPTSSRRLRFRLSAEDQPVEFSIKNPAYEK